MLTSARLGVVAVLLGPLVLFAFRFWLAGGSTEEFVIALLDGAVISAVDFVAYAATNPVMAGVYLVAMWLMWKFAFGG